MVLHVGVTVTVRFRTCSNVITTSVGLALIDKELWPIIALDLQCSSTAVFFGAITLGTVLCSNWKRLFACTIGI